MSNEDHEPIWLDSDGVVHVRNSERGTLNKCPQRWWWAWRDGLQPKETPKALWFGSAIHEALAHYYKPGKKRASLKSTLKKFSDYADMEAEYIRTEVGALDEDVWVDARTLGEEMLKNYVANYQGDEHWDVLATEQPFHLRVPFVGSHTVMTPLIERILEQYGDYFILDGTFDGVYRDERDGRIKLMEHKTAGSISTRHLPMDNQAGTYWLVAQTVGREKGWMGPKETIKEITYNFLRKAVPDDRPRDKHGYATNKPTKNAYINALEAAGHEFPTNKRGTPQYPTIPVMEEMALDYGLTVLGERSKSQPPPLFERHAVRKSPTMRKMQLARLQDEVVRMSAYVMGDLPLTKAPSRDTCPMCPFNDMCELHESGAGWVEYRDAMFRATDPYSDHRVTRKSA